MEKYLIAQTFSVAVTLVLVLTFYILLSSDIVVQKPNNVTNLILIIIAIICMAMFSTLTKIEFMMRTKRK